MTRQKAERFVDALAQFVIAFARRDCACGCSEILRAESSSALVAALVDPPEWPQDVDPPQQVVADRTGA